MTSGSIRWAILLLLGAGLFFLALAPGPATPRVNVKPADVQALMQRAIDFQKQKGLGPARTGWLMGVYWMGVLASYQATGEESWHEDVMRWGNGVRWTVQRGFYADSLAAGQNFIDLYLLDKQPEMIADVQAKLDAYFDKKTLVREEIAKPHLFEEVPWTGHNLWWWCDALFMGPPALAGLSSATHDGKYRQLMHKLYWDAADKLFDEDEHLFYRDERFFPETKRSPGNKKIFWSRGNGWVYAGLIRIIDRLPLGDPARPRYIALFKKMTPSVLRWQATDGLWRSSMNDITWIPNPETSGSGLFVYGLLAGINRGFLDRSDVLPAAIKGWEGLLSHVSPEGGLGYVQPSGDSPQPAKPENHESFGQGILLLAASEMYRLAKHDHER